jgi:hypothetical protein
MLITKGCVHGSPTPDGESFPAFVIMPAVSKSLARIAVFWHSDHLIGT